MLMGLVQISTRTSATTMVTPFGSVVNGESLFGRLTLRWRHNDCGGVSNHQPHDCLLNRIFGRISKEHQSSASLAFVREIHRGPVNFPHKWPVTRKMFPFDDVIMKVCSTVYPWSHISVWFTAILALVEMFFWLLVSWWRHQMETFSA